MDELARFRRMFTYDAFAQREMLKAIGNGRTPLPEALKTLGHVVAAQQLWLERLKGEPQSTAVWPAIDVIGCAAEIDRLAQMWPAYLATPDAAALDGEVAYVNSKGEAFRSRRRDILEHVILHGVHHRGQILAALRESGIEPPYVDFIHAVRTRRIE